MPNLLCFMFFCLEDRVATAFSTVLGVETHIVTHNAPGPLNTRECLESAAYPYWASLLVAVCMNPIFSRAKLPLTSLELAQNVLLKCFFIILYL